MALEEVRCVVGGFKDNQLTWDSKTKSQAISKMPPISRKDSSQTTKRRKNMATYSFFCSLSLDTSPIFVVWLQWQR
jgi:hypothetical protein